MATLMCVLSLYVRQIPGVPLVVAANRDEFRARTATPPGELEPGVIGGKDLQGGGTWLGLNRHGLFVAVTNRHAPARTPDSCSRGLLALEALRCRNLGGVESLVRKRVDERPVAGFNLVAAIDGEGVCIEFDGSLRAKTLPPGVHVVSTNRDLDDPAMPERRVVEAFEPSADPAKLRELLSSHDGDRPICKHGDAYGTVSSTIYVEGREPKLLHAEGNPCAAEFRDFSRLLDR